MPVITTPRFDGDGVLIPAAAPPAALAIFGDGSDGDVTIAADTTLTRDMFYNNLTVNATFVLNTAGYRVFVKGTLTNNGSISNDGGVGGNGVADNFGLPGVNAPAGSIGRVAVQTGRGARADAGTSRNGGGGGGQGGVVLISARTIVNAGAIRANAGAGGNGATADSTATAAASVAADSLADALGGSGGNGAGTGFSAGGTATPPVANDGGFRAPPFAIRLREDVSNVLVGGGCGGGGGGLNVNPTQGGGGGGGGGGLVVLIYNSYSGAGTKTAAGGAGGALDGVAGSAGTVIEIPNA